MAIPFSRPQWVLLPLILAAAIVADASAQALSPAQMLQNDLKSAIFLGSPSGNTATPDATPEREGGSILVLGNLEVAGGAIDLSNGALIVNTSTFGFVPSGGQPNELGTPGSPEYGDNAIHDALAEGANYANGLWNGTNGIISSWAANNQDGIAAVGWVDNSITQYATFAGIAVTTNESIIATTWYGDALLEGITNGDGYSAWLGTVLNPAGNTISPNTGTAPINWIDGDYTNQLAVGWPEETSNYSAWLGAILDPLRPGDPYGMYKITLYNPQYGTVQPASSVAVPEPGTCLLLLSGLGIALLGARAARKRRSVLVSQFNLGNPCETSAK